MSKRVWVPTPETAQGPRPAIRIRRGRPFAAGRLPVSRGAQRAVLAALFEGPQAALDALLVLRELGPVQASVATAAGAMPASPLTLLAGRIPYDIVGRAMEAIRGHGGRVMTNVDERRAYPSVIREVGSVGFSAEEG